MPPKNRPRFDKKITNKKTAIKADALKRWRVYWNQSSFYAFLSLM